MNLQGKKILVTGGGGTGVGKGICDVLSSYNATLIINERKFVDAKLAAKNYPGAIPVAGDIGIIKSVNEMFRVIRDKAGVLDGLVNNAGVGLSKPAHEATDEEFDRLFNIDIKGVWQVSKAFVKQLLNAQQPGNIVNISSVHAHSSMSRYALYSSVKSAVEGLTRGMAVELGPFNIRVNAIGPGYVHSKQNYDLIRTWSDDPEKWVNDYITDQQVLYRKIEPEDCGNVAAFLLSDLSRSVTGQIIYVDNGTTSMLYNQSLLNTRDR